MNDLPFRPNVCLLVINRDRLLFLGQRDANVGVWQFPQGGVEPGTTPEESAIREAHEEIGAPIELFKVVRKFDWTYQYDFRVTPDYAVEKWRGQAQTFWLLEYSGSDNDIDLKCHHHPEFSSWRWCTVEEVRKYADPHRLIGYKGALEELEVHLSSI